MPEKLLPTDATPSSARPGWSGVIRGSVRIRHRVTPLKRVG